MKQKSTTLGKQILHNANLRPNSPYILPIKKARKNRIYDYDHNKYIDFYLHKGCVPLGYKPQQISTALSNRLSMGFLGGFYTHLPYRAMNSIQDFFTSLGITLKHQILFFPTKNTLQDFVKAQDFSILSIEFEDYKNIQTEKIYQLNNFISNGYPIYTLLLPQNIKIENYSLSLDISPLAYETIIQTLGQLIKKDLEVHTKALITPFLKSISNIGVNYFDINTNIYQWEILAPKLLEYGMIVDIKQPRLYTCLQTTIIDIKYLFSTLKHLSE